MVLMRFTAKFGERFALVHSLMCRCLPSSKRSLKSKPTRLFLSAKAMRRGIIRIIGVTPVSLSLDILSLVTPNVDSIGSELALCTSPSFKRERAHVLNIPRYKSQLFAVAHASRSSFLSRVFCNGQQSLATTRCF